MNDLIESGKENITGEISAEVPSQGMSYTYEPQMTPPPIGQQNMHGQPVQMPHQGGFYNCAPGSHRPGQWYYNQGYMPMQANANSCAPQYNNNGRDARNEQNITHEKEKAEYKWNLSDYDEFTYKDNSARKQNKGSGVIIFVLSLIAALSLCLAAFAGLSLLSPIQLPQLNDWYEELPLVPVIPQAPVSRSHEPVFVKIELAGKPQIGEEQIVPNGVLTIPQVAELVIPSVVSVVKYTENNYLDPRGMASGVVLTDDGYIITNAHVVEGRYSFQVHLHDGAQYDAHVIGIDTATDLAVMKIDAENLTPAQFGSSDEIKVGETVVAIGNPVNLSFAGSVTQGIVSALNRQIDDSRYSVSYIQTDAAINPGNSGGALVNEYAQVVGINVAKIAAAGYEGMGFAIPMSEAQPIIEELLANGYVTGRVMLGITGYALDETTAARDGRLPGVIIETISEKSGLAGMDVRKGDIITHIDNVPIRSVTDIHAAIEGKRVGDMLRLTIYRGAGTQQATEMTIDVPLVEDIR